MKDIICKGLIVICGTAIDPKAFKFLRLGKTLKTYYYAENSLHPVEQVKLAEKIAKEVKSGLDVLVTSHSPYIAEALKKYAIDNKIYKDKTNFYFASLNKSGELEIKHTDEYEEKEGIIFKSFLEAYEILDREK